MQTSSVETITDSERSIVRSKVYGTLAKRGKRGEHGPFRVVKLFQQVCDELVEVHMIPPGPRGSPYDELTPDDPSHLPDFHVPSRIACFVRKVLWELYLQGILAPAPESQCPVSVDRKPPFSYLDLDCAVLTPYGVDIVTDSTNRIQVHDPDGYLANFWNASPAPDPEMMRYLQECVSVFRGGHFLATVVLLGIASERLIEVLGESLRDALGDREWFNRYCRKRDISERFKSLSGKLMSQYGEELNREKLKDAFNGVVTMTFEQIRLARNEISHPTDRQFSWNEVSGFLHNFVQYFIYVNRIIALLRSKPTST